MRHALLPVLAAAALAAPAAAQADSIVYTNVADLEIYAANADGSRPVKLTSGGGKDAPWRYPSQADDGVVLALQGGELVRFDQAGKVLGRTTPVGGEHGGVQGPYSPKISPDGTKALYDVYVQTTYETPDSIMLSHGWYTIYQDLASGKMLNYLGRYHQASWLGDSNSVVGFDDWAHPASDVAIHSIDRKWNDTDQWLWAGSDSPIGGGELTRDERYLAAVHAPAGNSGSDVDGNHMAIYETNGHTGAPVDEDGVTIDNVTGSTMRDPSWAPDDKSLIWWETKTGVYRTTFDGTAGSIKPELIIPSAGQADLGPADRGPGLQPVQVTPTPTVTGTATPTPGPEVKPTVTIARGVGAKALKKGLVVRVASVAPASAGVTVADGERVVGRAVKALPAGGGTVRVKISRKARERLGRRGHRSLKVTVAVSSVTTTKVVRVRR